MKLFERCWLVALLLVTCQPASATQRQEWQTDRFALIAGTSAAALGAGWLVGNSGFAGWRVLDKPSAAELRLQRWLGGAYTPHKTNLLNRRFGGIATPVAALLLLSATNIAWPERTGGEDALGDGLYFTAGLSATAGVTGLAKGLLYRRRPEVFFSADPETDSAITTNRDQRRSFFSGHTSSAFFALTFLNKRVRQTMRASMSGDEYRNWRWLPPLALYGWGTLVGWSRIHAYKHFVSDVVIGAAAGWLIGELFYRLGEDSAKAGSQNIVPLLQLRINFK